MPRAAVKILRLLLLAGLGAGLVYVLLNRETIDAGLIVEYARSHSGLETALLFIGVHVIASLFFVPRLFLGAAAGVMFGFAGGTLLGIAGGVTGGVAGFLIVRFVNGDSVRLREAPAIGPWLERAETYGWKLVLVARLIPAIPHSMANYVFGLSKIGLVPYTLGSALGIVPTAAIYASMGATGGQIATGQASWDTWALMAVWGFGLLFVSWLLPKLILKFWPELLGR
jgi:uncharacterized membrane protein YdjX (TVP38/TMEM64 family)